MQISLLLLCSYAHASIASPLSGRSQPAHGADHISGASVNFERDADVPLGPRLSERDATAYNALGTFGPNGLMGSVNTNGEAVTSNGNSNDDPANTYVAPFICFGRCASAAVVYVATYLATLGIEATISFIKKFLSFRNNDPDWPMYPDKSVLWSIRTFRTTDCGREGVRTGIDPIESDSTGPFMMSEYKSTNFNYHDQKPCENFMFMNPSDIDEIQVQSVAVWLHSSVQNGYIFLYTSPQCDATVINNETQNYFTSDYSNLVAIYNGQGALYQGDGEDDNSIVEPGVWACFNAYQATWNAFSVVQIGTTDMTIPDGYYQDGHIPLSDTQPKNRAPGQNANTSENTPWAADDWEQVGPAPYNALADPETYIIGESTGGD